MLKFKIADEVEALGIIGGYFVISGLHNTLNDTTFDALRAEWVAKELSELSPNSIETDKTLLGFRALHEKVKVSNRRHVSSPENLLQMLLRNKRLPSINLAVDIYNLVSIKSKLAVGAHDTAAVSGNIQLRITAGNENFIPLGQSEAKPVSAGEYAYIDDMNDILCRLEVRQVEKTKVTVETNECFYIVQGNLNTPASLIKESCESIIDLTTRFCGGTATILHSCW